MEEKNPLFDVGNIFGLKTYGPDGIQPIELKYPTDEQWLDRESRRKTIITFSESGDQTSDVMDADDDEVELLKQLCIGTIPSHMDAAEAGRLIDGLAYAEHMNSGDVVHGGQLKVVLQVPGALTIHTFRMPTAREEQHYDRNLYDQKPFGKKKIMSVRNLRFMGELYEKMIVQYEGYASGTVPINHKADALFLAFLNLKHETDPKRNFQIRSGRPDRPSDSSSDMSSEGASSAI
jgi:hypothetical protein